MYYSQDDNIKKTLHSQGVKRGIYDIFKLKNPQKYAKLISQYGIHQKTGLEGFKSVLRQEARRAYYK